MAAGREQFLQGGEQNSSNYYFSNWKQFYAWFKRLRCCSFR